MYLSVHPGMSTYYAAHHDITLRLYTSTISVLDSIYPCSCRTSAKPKLFSLTLEGVPNLNGAHMSLILRLACCPLCLTKSSVFVTVCVAITVGQHYPPTHRMQKHSSRIKKLASHWQQRWQAQTCSSCSLPLCFRRLSAGKQCKLRAYALGKIGRHKRFDLAVDSKALCQGKALSKQDVN